LRVRCYLFNALRRSQDFHARPFTAGMFVDEPTAAFLNAVVKDPAAAARDAPLGLADAALESGILTRSDADDEDAHWKALEAQLPEHPKISWIEITNRCEMTCSFCDRSEMRRHVADMSRERLASGLVQCRESGQKVVQLYGLGEPLLHPDLPEFVRMAADAGLHPAFSCVPVYLTPALTDALIDAGLKAIIFSIDSLDAEVFRSVRGAKADLALCLANVDDFLERNAARGKPVQTTVRMISLSANDEERERYLAYWRARDVDVVYVRPFGVHEHHVASRRQRLQEWKGGWTSLKLCTWPWHSSVATVDGRLHACCMRSSGPMVMGSWTETPAKETWRNAAYEELRRALKAGTFEEDHPCATCAHSFHNVKARLDRIHETLETIDDLPAVGWEF
jgi:MoaA/NifB/PqqE/SkfB family radical SAM enzyme